VAKAQVQAQNPDRSFMGDGEGINTIVSVDTPEFGYVPS
jgi:hypothetical protein